MRRRVEELKDAPDPPCLEITVSAVISSTTRRITDPRWTKTHSVTSLRLGLFANQLDHRHLHQLVHARDLVKVVEEVSDGRGLRNAAEGDERVALAGGIGFLGGHSANASLGT
jgi:hypothetical protein